MREKDHEIQIKADLLEREIIRPRHLTFVEGFPTIVCLCGSTRFMEAFQDANLEETLKGNIVLTVGCNTKDDAGLKLPPSVKRKLDALHKSKIFIADEILVLNVDGYIGESTRSEIEYAKSLRKIIRYLEEPKA